MVGAARLLFVGCALLQPGSPPTVPSSAGAAAQGAAPHAYAVGPGDVLEITVVDQPDLSRSTTVQPDGRLTMALLGDVEVSGKTIAEIQRIITERLALDFLVNPLVEVRVREYASQFALVIGEVVNPGRRALRGNTRLIDLLIESGGFRLGASGVVLVQRTEGLLPNGAKTLKFRLGAASGLSEADRSNAELVLKNGDLVTAAPKYYVTVDGEVGRPGRVVIDNDLTLLGVIAESGGLAKFGSSKVRIIRKKAEGVDVTGFEPCEGATQDLCIVVDLNEIRKGKTPDIVLTQNDKVVVSRRHF